MDTGHEVIPAGALIEWGLFAGAPSSPTLSDGDNAEHTRFCRKILPGDWIQPHSLVRVRIEDHNTDGHIVQLGEGTITVHLDELQSRHFFVAQRERAFAFCSVWHVRVGYASVWHKLAPETMRMILQHLFLHNAVTLPRAALETSAGHVGVTRAMVTRGNNGILFYEEGGSEKVMVRDVCQAQDGFDAILDLEDGNLLACKSEDVLAVHT